MPGLFVLPNALVVAGVDVAPNTFVFDDAGGLPNALEPKGPAADLLGVPKALVVGCEKAEDGAELLEACPKAV